MASIGTSMASIGTSMIGASVEALVDNNLPQTVQLEVDIGKSVAGRWMNSLFGEVGEASTGSKSKLQ
jgi:hypothetical protein